MSTQARSRLCAVSVDLDEIPEYHALHGLSPPQPASSNLVYDVALRRIEEFARAHDLPLTLFVIAADLERPSNAAVLRALVDQGHELGNHSLDHQYELTRLSRSELIRQVEGGAARIGELTGRRPCGFRAPGYTVSDELFAVLRECGALYDSSVFPCPAYYAAKASARLWMRARGRRSSSVLDTPQVLRAPTRPYRVGQPYWRTGQGLLELPIQVTRRLRLPYIGTTLTLAGPDRATWLTRGVIGEPVVNLELHGIDFLDWADGLDALHPFQPDVRVPRDRKMLALERAISNLRHARYAFATLEEVASAHA